MKIGVIGAGAIANFLFEKINEQQQENLRINSVFVRNKEKYKHLESKYAVNLYTELDEFLDSDIDIVVEAANITTVECLLPTILKKKDAIVISIGAFADSTLLAEVSNLISEYKNNVYLSSGAIGGLDLLQNAHALGTVDKVTLTTRKPAKTLIEKEITSERVVFEGKAVDAIKLFPRNMNVSIVLSLAGLGIDFTNVRLIADPHIDKNIHQIEIVGDFGEATFTITNNPLPENPRTSYLAAMSILGTLKRINYNFKIG
ncbi:aspartate dehydrogenase [Pallidibacillus pasinlerensis]|uniref:L-aspartate dehydrogenase n=1 Tax=Pallidibacillus pasinlerensis TaxID=2703818 RepID=A0ABX0A709_9BACI|nr:aspartate dehydrogenase [Pallidibacillus pasinlerensis]NCU18602.1 aspartate dehydrogenase [Pallidibacillus pasinlerensis]